MIAQAPLERVGRDGSLHLVFASRCGRTVLIERRFTTPLQVLEPITLVDDGSLYVLLLNPTGGLLGGDRLTSQIELGDGTHVCFTTPSATKVYRADGPPTVQRTRLKVGAGATLEYFPDHLIPHPGARLEQALDIELSPTGRALVWDAFSIGRLARDERWLFDELDSRIRIVCAERPLVHDRLQLGAEAARFDGLGGTEGRGYVATLIALDAGFDGWEGLSLELEARLGQTDDLIGGASPLPTGGCFIRLISPSAPDLTRRMHALWGLLRRRVLGREPIDWRKS